MIANPLRNEITVLLNDRPYYMRATFNALVEVETIFGKPMTKIMESISEASLSLGQIKSTILAGCKGSGQEVEEEQLEQDIVEGGLVAANAAVVDFLLVATIGGEKVKKNYVAELTAITTNLQTD